MTSSVFGTGKVAVVTGAASGIGRATCCKLAELGMSVCLADLAGADFDEAADAVTKRAAKGAASVMAHATDVGDLIEVQALQRSVNDRFGDVHFLMNNAVTRVGRDKPADLTQWRRAMDVNFWGVVYGVDVFLPGMLAMGADGCIVNVGSKQGITNPPGNTIYNASKSALKTYTEALQHDLRSGGGRGDDCNISAHLLIPGWTTTGKS